MKSMDAVDRERLRQGQLPGSGIDNPPPRNCHGYSSDPSDELFGAGMRSVVPEAARLHCMAVRPQVFSAVHAGGSAQPCVSSGTLLRHSRRRNRSSSHTYLHMPHTRCCTPWQGRVTLSESIFLEMPVIVEATRYKMVKYCLGRRECVRS